MIYRLASYLLRGHVPSGSHDRAGLGRSRPGKGGAFSGTVDINNRLFCQSEVENLYPVIFSNEDVVGLEVTMNNTLFMCGGESASNFYGVFRDAALAEKSGIHL